MSMPIRFPESGSFRLQPFHKSQSHEFTFTTSFLERCSTERDVKKPMFIHLSLRSGGLVPMAPPESLSPSGVALACVLRNATSDNDVVSTAAPDSISNEEETSYVAFRNWISSGSPDKMKPGPPTNASSILCLLFEKSMAPLRLPATVLDNRPAQFFFGKEPQTIQ